MTIVDQLTNITPILNALVRLVAVIILVCVIPWIKRKCSAEDLQQLLAWVKIAVAAAEQLYERFEGDKKLEYVLQYLKDKGYSIDQSLVNVVESEVLRLHAALYGSGEEASDVDGD